MFDILIVAMICIIVPYISNHAEVNIQQINNDLTVIVLFSVNVYNNNRLCLLGKKIF